MLRKNDLVTLENSRETTLYFVNQQVRVKKIKHLFYLSYMNSTK